MYVRGRLLLPPLILFALMVSVRLILPVLLVSIGVSVAHGQERAASSPDSVPDTVERRIATAFERGDVQALLTSASDRVEVSLLGARTIYSDAQAFYVLREFFESHPPARFTLDDVATEGESGFVRGTFEHRRDERNFQVYVRLVHEHESWRLQEVRIDSEAG